MAALTGAMMALSAGSALSQFAGQRSAAAAAQQQGDYAASIYSQNAELADAQAADAIARGKESELRSRQGTQQVIGAQRAGLAASGVDISTGSAVDVQAEAARVGELDALTIRNNARREAYGFQVQAAQDRAQAVMAHAAGANTAQSLRNQSYGTLLTGAANTYGIYKQYGMGGSNKQVIQSATKVARGVAGGGFYGGNR